MEYFTCCVVLYLLEHGIVSNIDGSKQTLFVSSCERVMKLTRLKREKNRRRKCKRTCTEGKECPLRHRPV